MKYMLLVHEAQNGFDKRNDQNAIAAGRAYGKALQAAGIFVAGAGLESPQAATTVSVRDGNTAKALNRLVRDLSCETVDLNNQKVSRFSYAQNYTDDDFIGIVQHVIQAPITILATPVYWYSYSVPMKIFIDRFTDLLLTEKDLGRQLRGCNFALLSTGYAPQPNETLQQAFDSFCNYLGINNLGTAYVSQEGPLYDEQVVLDIRQRIERAECRN